MPVLSKFLGIKIMMYFNEHNPPHFHAKYEEYKAMISINDLALLKGELPPRVLSLVVEWACLHKDKLLKNWEMVKETGEWFKIEPLI